MLREVPGWEDWLDVKFGWSEPTAKKFIAVAKAFGSRRS
jgi:hypothetical protein